MNRILRENRIYILAVLLIWAIFVPIIIKNRNTILSDIAIWYSSPGFKEKTAESLLAKSKSKIEDSKTDLSMLRRACELSRAHSGEKQPPRPLTWREKAKNWKDPEALPPQNQYDMGIQVLPQEYWNRHYLHALDALDYAKRSLHYSGPLREYPEWIESLGRALCMEGEIFLGYSDYIQNIQAYALENQKEALSNDITQKQAQIQILSLIRKGKVPRVIAKDFGYALDKLNYESRLTIVSPREADFYMELRVFFLAGDEYERNLAQKKRADLNYELASENPDYFKKAVLLYEDSARFVDWDELDKQGKFNSAQTILFESVLGKAKCYIELQEYNRAIHSLESLKRNVRMFDERNPRAMNKTLLSEYRATLKKAYRKIGRFEVADEIPD